MPRVTKRQKEAGKAPNKPKTFKPKAKAPSGPNAGAKKQAFNVRPARAPKDAYLGKAQKLKADLIERAHIKKQYAKVLRAEGMQSERLGDGSRRRGERDEPRTIQDGGKGGKSSWKGKGKERSREGGSGGQDDDPEMARLLARAGPASNQTSSRPFSSNSSKFSSNRRTKGPSPPPPPPRPRALSTSPPPTAPSTTEPKASLRQLRKESFGKFHRPRDSTGASLPSARGRARGQPNMGARMGALLEQIKRVKS